MTEQRYLLVDGTRYTLPPAAASYFAQQAIDGPYRLQVDEEGGSADCLHIYWDTAEYRLLRTGVAVCLAQADTELHLSVENLTSTFRGKLDKPVQKRSSVTAPIASGKVAAHVKAWPKPLRKSIASMLAGSAKLQPMLRLQAKPTRYLLWRTDRPDDAPLAQLTVTVVTVWPAIETSNADLHHLSAPDPADAVTTLAQLQLAFRAQATDEQGAIRAWVTKHFPAEPTKQSLFAQAWLAAGLRLPQTPTALQAAMSMIDACRLIWRTELVQMLLNEAGARYSDEPDYVHEMRVAIRRARAAAKLYQDHLPHKTIRPYLAVLRKTGRLLGEVRNLDVAIHKGRRLHNAAGKRTHAPKKLIKAWQQARQVAKQDLVKWLDSSDYQDFVHAFQQFCVTENVTHLKHKPHDQKEAHAARLSQVRIVIPALIMACYAEVRSYEAVVAHPSSHAVPEESADLPPNPPVDYTLLHDLRIAGKALRYNLEFTRHLLGPESEQLIQAIKRLQDLLGDLNDAVTALELIKETDQADQAAAYQRTQAVLMDDLRTQVAGALATLVAPESRHLLGRALAAL